MFPNTEDKEREILQEKAHLSGLIASIMDSLIEVDAEEKINIVNRATLDLLGYSEEELLGQPLGLILGEKKPFFRGKRLKKIIEQGSVHDDDLTFVTKQGEEIPVSFTGSVLRQINCPRDGKPRGDCSKYIEKGTHCGKIVGIICVARDMRQIKGLITDLEKANKELEMWSKTLEKRVEERTKELVQAQEATLNILEDLEESREELEQYSKELEKKVKERAAEATKANRKLEAFPK